MKKAIVFYKPKHILYTNEIFSESITEISCDKIKQENLLLYFLKKEVIVKIININCIKNITVK